jgi:hypothetical protein
MMVTNDWEVGTQKLHTYQKESDAMAGDEVTPELQALVREIIGRVADKWTMLVLEALEEHGRMRFTRLGEFIGGVSQKMLTKTLRQMEADRRTGFAHCVPGDPSQGRIRTNRPRPQPGRSVLWRVDLG